MVSAKAAAASSNFYPILNKEKHLNLKICGENLHLLHFKMNVNALLNVTPKSIL